MKDSTKEKIQNILSDLIDRRRLVFWYDEGGQMQEFTNSLEIPGVEILMLENNAFTLKYRILKGEQPERGFLIYSSQAQPNDENNWLLDLQMEAIPFSADMESLYAAECGIPMELKQKVVDKHQAFFQTTINRTKLTARLRQGMDADVIERQMLAVVCCTEPYYDQLTFALAQEALKEESEMYDKLVQYNLSDIYWNEIEKVFGYNKQRKIKDLIIVLFKNDMNRHFSKGTLSNEAAIFMHDWRDSRQYGEMYKQWAELLEIELNIKQSLQDHSIENLITIETFPCIDKVIAQYLQPDVINGTISVERIESIID